MEELKFVEENLLIYDTIVELSNKCIIKMD